MFPDLREILKETSYAFVGAAATRLYMPERATDDLDILVCADDYPAVRDAFIKVSFSYFGERTIGGGQWATSNGYSVDVIALNDWWCARAIEEAQTNRDPHGNPILPLPHLVYMKFLANRAKEMCDLAQILGQATEAQLAATRALFRRDLPGEIEDLASLIVLGRLEFAVPPSKP